MISVLCKVSEIKFWDPVACKRYLLCCVNWWHARLNPATVWQTNFLLRPAQTISTCLHNISQHCWAQHVAHVWPPCYDVLQHVGCCWLKFETGQIWANNTRHVSTQWPNALNKLRPKMLRYVVLPCCDRLAGALISCHFSCLFPKLKTCPVLMVLRTLNNLVRKTL